MPSDTQHSIKAVSLFSIDLPWSKKHFAATASIMFAVWMIWAVIFYPGSMNWDTFYQIAMNYHGQYPIYAIPWAPTGSVVDYAYSDHHPLFDTLIFGAFAQVSDVLSGNWNLGIFAYIVLQSLATAFSVVFSVAYAAKLGTPRWAQYTLAAFFAFMPFYAAYVSTMIKDSFFSWLYVLYFLLLTEVVLTKGKYLQNKKALIWFVVLGCLLALTKKTGVYLVVATLLIFCFMYRSAIKQFVMAAAFPAAIIWLVMPLIVFPALNIVGGASRRC